MIDVDEFPIQQLIDTNDISILDRDVLDVVDSSNEYKI
jgi:hypothetical protein